MKELKPHPLSEIFPMMNNAEYTVLLDDIRENGLKRPIVIYKDKIVDGRNRLKACQELGIEPRFEECKESDIQQIIFSENIARRSLNDAQRSCSATEWYMIVKRDPIELLAKANERRKSGELKPSEKTYKGKRFEDRLIIQVAKKFNVGAGNMIKLVSIKKHQPLIFEKVKNGEMKVASAYQQYRLKSGVKPRLDRIHEVTTNYNAMQQVNLPSVYDSHEAIHNLIKKMLQNGWLGEMKMTPCHIPGTSEIGVLYKMHFYGNGTASLHTCWTTCHAEPEFRRAIVVAAREAIERGKPVSEKAA